MNLLEKGAIEIVPPAQSESGFYSHYFLVPKKDSSLRPIPDLRLLKSHPDEKIVQYDHFETDPLANMPRGLVCVAGRRFSHPDSPHLRLFLRFAFEGVAYQHQVNAKPIQFWLKQRVPTAAWHHGHHRVMVTQACVSALNRWRNPLRLKRGVTLNTAHRRKVVTTDASNKGWGALCEDKPTFGLWSEEESTLHINCLEMLAVCQACQFFLPDIRGHHVLVRSDSRSMVSSINHQGGLVSK